MPEIGDLMQRSDFMQKNVQIQGNSSCDYSAPCDYSALHSTYYIIHGRYVKRTFILDPMLTTVLFFQVRGFL